MNIRLLWLLGLLILPSLSNAGVSSVYVRMTINSVESILYALDEINKIDSCSEGVLSMELGETERHGNQELKGLESIVEWSKKITACRMQSCIYGVWMEGDSFDGGLCSLNSNGAVYEGREVLFGDFYWCSEGRAYKTRLSM